MKLARPILSKVESNIHEMNTASTLPSDSATNVPAYINSNFLAQNDLLKKVVGVGTTVGCATVAAATICGPLKSIKLSCAAGKMPRLPQIFSTLKPTEIAPQFKAILLNNLTLFGPKLILDVAVDRLPGFKNLSQPQKAALTSIGSAVICTSAFLKQGIKANNLMISGVNAGAQELVAARGKNTLIGTAAAFVTRETTGIAAFSMPENTALVNQATAVSTLADLIFSSLSTVSVNKLSPAAIAGFCISRGLEAKLLIATTQVMTAVIAKQAHQLMQLESQSNDKSQC